MTPASRNPDFANAVTASFNQQGMMALLGTQLIAVAPGTCSISAPIRPEASQQHGYAHAGLA